MGCQAHQAKRAETGGPQQLSLSWGAARSRGLVEELAIGTISPETGPRTSLTVGVADILSVDDAAGAVALSDGRVKKAATTLQRQGEPVGLVSQGRIQRRRDFRHASWVQLVEAERLRYGSG